MSFVRVPSRPSSCCIVIEETSSSGKRSPYIARATRILSLGRLTRRALVSNTRLDRVVDVPAAYKRTPFSPTHATETHASARRVIAPWVTVVPGPRRMHAIVAAGTRNSSTSVATVNDQLWRSIRQRSKYIVEILSAIRPTSDAPERHHMSLEPLQQWREM